MTTRITNSMVVRTALTGIYGARRRLSVTQEQAASGLRVNRPSDDPASASHASRLRADTAAIVQYGRNVEQVRSRLATAEDSIRTANDVLVRAREVAIQGANGTLDAGARSILAQEVESLVEEMLAAGNARNTGAWIFAGTASGTPAFSASGPFVAGTPAPTVAFGGNSTEIQVAIGEDQRVAATLDGRRVFLGDADGDGTADAGREDVFAVLGELWRSLDGDDQAGVAATLDRLDRARLGLELELARVGATGKQLDSAADRLERDRLAVRQSLSDAEDADTEDVFSRLVAQEVALQAALEAAARSVQPSLIDFLA
jgi:flagellar hook-associated protein 3 FlgL